MPALDGVGVGVGEGHKPEHRPLLGPEALIEDPHTADVPGTPKPHGGGGWPSTDWGGLCVKLSFTQLRGLPCRRGKGCVGFSRQPRHLALPQRCFWPLVQAPRPCSGLPFGSWEEFPSNAAQGPLFCSWPGAFPLQYRGHVCHCRRAGALLPAFLTGRAIDHLSKGGAAR